MAETARSLKGSLEVLQLYSGYPAFRPGQENAIRAMLAGRDTLTIMPTGGGKSLCYQVPAMPLPGVTLVVARLISLMKDQVDALEGAGLPATFIKPAPSSSGMAARLDAVALRLRRVHDAASRRGAAARAQDSRPTRRGRGMGHPNPPVAYGGRCRRCGFRTDELEIASALSIPNARG